MMKLVYILVVLYSFYFQTTHVASLLPDMGTPFFVSNKQAREKELTKLKEHLSELLKKSKDDKDRREQQSHIIKQEIIQTKEALTLAPEDPFYLSKLSMLTDRAQALKDLSQLVDRLIAVMTEYIQLLEEYVKDPELKQYYNELELGATQRIAFSFEDLRQIKEKIESKKASIELLQQQDAHTLAEIKSREQTAAALAQQCKQKKAEREAITQEVDSVFDLSEKQKRELTNLEFALISTKKIIDDFQLQILEFRLKKIRIKIELEKLQLQILQEVFTHIKQSSIHISEADLAFARDELEKKRQELNAAKIDIYEPKKEALKQQIVHAKEELELLSKQNNIPINEELEEWNFAPKGSIDAYEAFFIVAKMNTALIVARLEFEELESQMVLQDQILFLERVATDIKSSFYKIYAGKFISEEKIFEEIKRYEVRLSDIRADVSQLENKKTMIEAQLTNAKKASENITAKEQELAHQKDRMIKGDANRYTRIKDLLVQAEVLVQEQIKMLNAIRSTYNDTVLKLVKTEQQIKFTIEELRASSRSIIWDRPEDAISWQGALAAIPNIETFVHDVRSYILYFDLKSLAYKVKASFFRHYSLLHIFLYFICWLVFLLVTWFGVSWLSKHHVTCQNNRCRKTEQIQIVGYVIALFLKEYFISFMLWTFCMLLSILYLIPDPYPYIIFYVVSIPLLLFFANRFMNVLQSTNAAYDYTLITKEYERRFFLCVSTLVSATIIIFFFRQAFILGNYPKSELPNILKALNIIILQITIIFLLTKELVLSIIPRSNDIWMWIREKVDYYYYLLLMVIIAIIIMMNPYVGFGRLVLFILSRVIYTFLLIGLLVWLHGLVKSWSSALFFHTDQDGVKERFPVAKTWYGISIICILLLFMCIGLIVVAKIWQWPEQLKNIKEMRDIFEWLQTPLLGQDTQSPISFYTIMQFLLFVLGGFLVATGIRRFVLSRIFDILLVDSGVQNTVNSLMRYVIYLIAIMLGLNAAGLGAQINLMIGALLVGIGIIIKDPAADFFAYFIILVQRPIKIGDYIKIDDEAMGVVRKITPRSVVLRRKNSTMIIIPNSYAVNHTIINWNYVRGFIAFNDIQVIISYKSDPIQVKEIFERILDGSPFVLKNPKPIVRLHEFNPNGYEFLLRGFISSNYTLDQWDIASDIRLQIVKVFKQQGIEFALPIRVMMNYQQSLLPERFNANIDAGASDMRE